MSWTYNLSQIQSLFQPDTPTNRILCAYEVIRSSLVSNITGEEVNLFLERELEICPVSMFCVYRRWRTYQKQLESDPDSLFRLVTNRPWDYGHGNPIRFPDPTLVLAF